MTISTNDQVSGVLVLNKPAGVSSRQAVDCVTSALPRVKVGHAGTLDPLATGVLVVCVGKATRLIPYVQRLRKEYDATLRLGVRSDTHDLEGLVQPSPLPARVTRDALERSLAKFRGNIVQVPPQHSAVHVEGRRAYELARAGKVVKLAPRPVTIERLECRRFDSPDADLEVRCSSGTYVRSLVRDVGDDLGCGAVMTRLVRSAVGSFRLEDALELAAEEGPTRGPPDQTAEPTLAIRPGSEAVRAMLVTLTRPMLLGALRPAADALQELPHVTVPPERLDDVRHGRTIDAAQLGRPPVAGLEWTLVDDAGNALAVAIADSSGRIVRPHIVLIAD